jgi:hypothetical protein
MTTKITKTVASAQNFSPSSGQNYGTKPTNLSPISKATLNISVSGPLHSTIRLLILLYVTIQHLNRHVLRNSTLSLLSLRYRHYKTIKLNTKSSNHIKTVMSLKFISRETVTLKLDVTSRNRACCLKLNNVQEVSSSNLGQEYVQVLKVGPKSFLSHSHQIRINENLGPSVY